MKTISLMLLMTAAMFGAETKPQAAEKTKPARAAAPTIPEGATQVEPFLYRYTDAQGKNWMYRQYPFGITKWEDKGAVANPVPNVAPVGVTDLGDSYRFEAKTPFGPQIWTRKKSDLTVDEKGFVGAAGKLPAERQ